MKKSVIALALAAATLSASAAPVSTWYYGISTQWNSAGFTSGSGTTYRDSSLISWGGAGGSSLAITDSPERGWISTGGAAVDANDITHTNNVVWSDYATLSSGTMRVNLGLEAFPYLPPADVSLSYLFNFKFIETPNNGQCAWSNGKGSNNCDDIFVFAGNASKSFSYAGESYVASLGFDKNFIALTASECGQFQFGAGCFALITDENAKTTGSMNLSVSRNSVPEPGTLALLGASLFGIAALRRRKSA